MVKRKLTKAMTSTFLIAGAALSVTGQPNRGSADIFRDVTGDDPYATAIHYLVERGVAIADRYGYFYPTKPISLAEALKMLERYLSEEGVASTTLGNGTMLAYEEVMLLLTDFMQLATGINSVEVVQASTESFTEYGEPYRQAVATLHALNIAAQQHISPQQIVTRGQFAFLLYSVIHHVIEAQQLQSMLQLDDFLLEQMVFAAHGEEAYGKGAIPGTTITVRNAYNEVIGTGFVQRDGSYRMPLFPAVLDGERIALQVKDEANNRSTIDKTVQLMTSTGTESVVIDFIVGSNEESPLAMSLEQFLHIVSGLHIVDEQFQATLQQARQTLANWQASNEELLLQLDAILYQLSVTLPTNALQQVHQMLFIELKLIAESLSSEMYSRASWRQVERELLQVGTLDVCHATQVQQAYYTLAALMTAFEEEQLTIQSGFYDLQDTILAIEVLLVPASMTGKDILPSEWWTTFEEKALLQQAVERALDVYIQMDPSITDILQVQAQLDLAIIRYEEAKRSGRAVSEQLKIQKKAL